LSNIQTLLLSGKQGLTLPQIALDVESPPPAVELVVFSLQRPVKISIYVRSI
jgi:hypothetical protein